MKISEITNYLESLAPKSMQESYDNAGLIVGNPNQEVKNVLVCLDCTEEIIAEAHQKGCELVIAHHPIVFKGLKSITGANYVERVVLEAIKKDIAIYASHTNLDNYNLGVNFQIGQKMGLENLKILAPKRSVLYKLSVFVPLENLDQLSSALFQAGAGSIGNYKDCHFYTKGTGTFRPVEGANPFSGELNELSKVDEVKAEYLVRKHDLGKVLFAMKMNHPYEEVAHDIIALENENQQEGSGMVGDLPEAMNTMDFLAMLKSTFGCGVIRHTRPIKDQVKRIAFCGGAGSFLLPHAKRERADVFVTGDYKYHEFFDAENHLVIADIGHYESEQFTSNLIADILKKKFTTFAVHITGINTNPINYF